MANLDNYLRRKSGVDTEFNAADIIRNLNSQEMTKPDPLARLQEISNQPTAPPPEKEPSTMQKLFRMALLVAPALMAQQGNKQNAKEIAPHGGYVPKKQPDAMTEVLKSIVKAREAKQQAKEQIQAMNEAKRQQKFKEALNIVKETTDRKQLAETIRHNKEVEAYTKEKSRAQIEGILARANLNEEQRNQILTDIEYLNTYGVYPARGTESTADKTTAEIKLLNARTNEAYARTAKLVADSGAADANIKANINTTKGKKVYVDMLDAYNYGKETGDYSSFNTIQNALANPEFTKDMQDISTTKTEGYQTSTGVTGAFTTTTQKTAPDVVELRRVWENLNRTRKLDNMSRPPATSQRPPALQDELPASVISHIKRVLNNNTLTDDAKMNVIMSYQEKYPYVDWKEVIKQYKK